MKERTQRIGKWWLEDFFLNWNCQLILHVEMRKKLRAEFERFLKKLTSFIRRDFFLSEKYYQDVVFFSIAKINFQHLTKALLRGNGWEKIRTFYKLTIDCILINFPLRESIACLGFKSIKLYNWHEITVD